MGEQQSAIVEDIACVLYFLLGAVREGQMFNSREALDAFEAACRLTGVDRRAFIARVQATKEPRDA